VAGGTAGRSVELSVTVLTSFLCNDNKIISRTSQPTITPVFSNQTTMGWINYEMLIQITQCVSLMHCQNMARALMTEPYASPNNNSASCIRSRQPGLDLGAFESRQPGPETECIVVSGPGSRDWIWRPSSPGSVLYLQRAACSAFQTCILNSH